MDDFRKTIMPGKLPHGASNTFIPTHFKIEFKNSRLSITGVIGARKNGSCAGSAGQCMDEPGNPALVLADKWTADDVSRFHDIRDRRHLNDMRPECEHQRADGWRDKAKTKVTLYHWQLTNDAMKQQTAARNAALSALKSGETFTPTKEQAFIASQPYYQTTHAETLSEQIRDFYEPKKSHLYRRFRVY
jgi:hypothetical protein